MRNVLVKLLICAAITASAFGADDPFLGTWKLNVEKSTLDPAAKMKSMTEIYEPVEGGVKWTATVERLDGTPGDQASYTAKYDGKDYPLKMGPGSDSIAINWVDANTHTFIVKKAGKVVMEGEERVSGKTLTKTVTGPGSLPPGEKPLKYVLEKQ
jgi:hypothetical protein